MAHRKDHSTRCSLTAGIFALVLALAATASPSAGQKPPASDPRTREERRLRAQEADRWNAEGLRLFAEGRFAQAAAAFQNVYKLFPEVPDVAYNLGLAYQRAGRHEESIAPLEQCVAGKPNDPAFHRALGVSLLNTNRLQEGARQLEKSLENDSKSVDTLYYLALAYYAQKEYDRAEECLRWMFERNPDSALLHLRTANAHRINRRYREALAELRRALALDANLPGLYLELGLTHIGLKDSAAARAALEEEIRRHPGSAEAHLTLGELSLVVTRDYARALKSIQQAQELGIEPVRAEFDLGDVYFRLGQFEVAERHLEETVKLDPEHRRARYLLARVYQRRGKTAQAQEQFALADALARQERKELVTSFRTMVEGEAPSN